MEVYYKFTIYNTSSVHFTNSVYMKDYSNGLRLMGISLIYKKRCFYSVLPLSWANDVFMIPLSLEEMNDTFKKYGSLL